MSEEIDDAIDEGATALRALFHTLDMLAHCQGNKAKLELAVVAVDRYLELQELCDQYRFTVAVGVTLSDLEQVYA